jgi:hypothetical protein
MFRDSLLGNANPLGNVACLRDVAFPAFSVASPILPPRPPNQNAAAWRISSESAITCKAWTEATETEASQTE